MAVPIDEFTIIEVRKPNVGENKPADVTADIVIDTSSKLQAYLTPKCCCQTLYPCCRVVSHTLLPLNSIFLQLMYCHCQLHDCAWCVRVCNKHMNRHLQWTQQCNSAYVLTCPLLVHQTKGRNGSGLAH